MRAKKAAGAGNRRSSQALDVYEKAMKALGKRDFVKAGQHLDALLSSFPEEREVVERARAYRSLCDRALEKQPAPRPKTVEDLLSHAVYHHNRDEFEQALKFLKRAKELAPDNDSVLYCTAATSARAGDSAAAIKALRSAIAVSPASRTQARSDSDFDPLRSDESFVELLQSP
jgi:tetratricopeptide (TPR) repeat protein